MNLCFRALLTPQVEARAAPKDTDELDKGEDEAQSAWPEIDLEKFVCVLF